MTYQVFEHDFVLLGTVTAATPEAAFAAAKRKYRNAAALMVSPV